MLVRVELCFRYVLLGLGLTVLEVIAHKCEGTGLMNESTVATIKLSGNFCITVHG